MERRGPKVAYLSPLQPVPSGISQYSEDLIPWLAAAVRLDVVTDGYRPAHAAALMRAGARVRGAGRFNPKRYDCTLIHMGNSPAHDYMVPHALAQTGGQGHVLVLHDVVLHHLMVWRAVRKRGGRESYRREMVEGYGEAAAPVADAVLRGQNPAAMFDYPLCEDLIRAARLVVTHSPSAAAWCGRLVPGTATRVVPMGVPPFLHADPAEARARLGIGPGTFVMLSLGHVNPFKRMPSVFRALRRLADLHPDVLLLIAGGDSPNYDVPRLARFAGVERYVRRVGYVADEALPDLFAASDVAINLRYPTAGETSAAVLRLMSGGLPVIVTDTGAFSDLPDDASLKVPPDAFEGETLVAYLHALAENAPLRRALAANARRYATERHSMERAARGFLDVIGEVTGTDAPTPLPPPRGEGGTYGKHENLPASPDAAAARSPFPMGKGAGGLGAFPDALAALGLATHEPTLRTTAAAMRDLGLGVSRERRVRLQWRRDRTT